MSIIESALNKANKVDNDLTVHRDGPNCLNRHYQFISEYLSFY